MEIRPLSALALVGMIAFPIVGQAVPMVAALPGDLASYVYLLALPFFALGCLLGIHGRRIDRTQAAILALILYCVILYLGKFALFGPTKEAFRLLRERTMGFVVAGLVIFAFNAAGSAENRRRFVSLFFLSLAGLFLIQCSLALIESRTGFFFERRGGEVASNLEYRDLLQTQSGWGMGKLGLHYALSGLLGQHNRFGMMLVFYNLVFLAQFIRKPDWVCLVLLMGVLAASALNTTKTSVFLILVSDVVTLMRLPRRFRPLIYAVAAATALIGAAVIGPWLWDVIALQRAGALGMQERLGKWSDLWAFYSQSGLENPLAAILGFGFAILASDPAMPAGFLQGSFECEYLLLFFNFGAAGLVLFAWAFCGSLFLRARRFRGPGTFILYLVSFNMLFSSVTMDLQTRWYTLPLAVFAIVSSIHALAEGGAEQGDSGRRTRTPSIAPSAGLEAKHATPTHA